MPRKTSYRIVLENYEVNLRLFYGEGGVCIRKVAKSGDTMIFREGTIIKKEGKEKYHIVLFFLGQKAGKRNGVK